MPIEFSQPGAFDRNIGEGYGRLSQLMAQGGGGYGGGGGGGRSYGGYGDGEVTQRDAFLAGQHLQGQMMGHEAQYQNELSLQQNRLTSQEETRMNQLQQALGAIDANPNLDEEARNDLKMQIKAGLDPLHAKMAKAKIAESEMHTKSMMQMMDEQSAARDRSRKFATQNLQSLVKNVMDPGIQTIAEQALAARNPQLAMRFSEGDQNATAEWNNQLIAEVRQRGGLSTWIQANADGSHTLLTPAAVPKPEIDLTHINTVNHQIEQDVDKWMEANSDKVPKGHKEREAFREDMIQLRTRNRNRRNAGQSGQGGGSEPDPKNEKPFDWRKPDQATPGQQQALQSIQNQERSLFAMTHPPGATEPPPGTMAYATKGLAIIHELKDLLGKYGHPENMPESDKNRYVSLGSQLANIIRSGPQAPKPPNNDLNFAPDRPFVPFGDVPF